MADDADEQLIIPEERIDRTIRYRDRYGNVQELRVTKATARVYNSIMRSYTRACKKWERKHVDFTTLEGPDAKRRMDVADDSRRLTTGQHNGRADRSQWEGPRLQFERFVGESQVWDGPPGKDARGKCECCHGVELEPAAYCLGCDKCGRDNLVRKPTRAELAARAEKQAPPADDAPVGHVEAKGKAKPLRGGTASTDKRRKKGPCSPARSKGKLAG